jgi:DNA-binding transcriptional ArsR family regulator
MGGRDVIAAAHLDESTAVSVAATLQALATTLPPADPHHPAPGCVLGHRTRHRRRHGAVRGLPPLRLLRTLGLVTGQRDGRRIVYRLYDDHVAQLLDQAVHHIEHLRLGVRDPD